MSGIEQQQNSTAPEEFTFDKLDNDDRRVIIFALGRAYMWCQFNGLDFFGGFNKNNFKDTAEKLGAKITEVK
jgi:hypothetical protein